MKANLKSGIAIAILIASLVAPCLLQSTGRAKLRDKQEFLRQQAGEAAQLKAENDRLSAIAIQPKTTLSEEQLRELMRLRSEAGQLHSTLAVAQNQTYYMTQSEFDRETALESLSALTNICRELPGMLQMYANDHTNQAPDRFSDLLRYFRALGGSGVGLYSFDFVREVEVGKSGEAIDLRPRDGIVLMEVYGHQTPDGKQSRFYGFMDGRSIEVTPDDGNFMTWEKQNLSLVPVNGRLSQSGD